MGYMDELLTRLVFIDTCIYQNKNFQFLTYELGKFMQLCESNKIILLTTELICHEVERHIDESSRHTSALLKKAKDDLRLLRNLPSYKTHGIFEEKLTCEVISAGMKANFTEFLETSNAEVVPISKASLDDIVKGYINSTPPFSVKKKEEFPDAITLSSLKKIAEERHQHIYVISSDGDMKSYCDGDRLISLDKVEDLLDLVIRNEAELEKPVELIDNLFAVAKDDIIKAIKDLIVDSQISVSMCLYPNFISLNELEVRFVSKNITDVMVEEDNTIRADVEIEVTVFAQITLKDTNYDACVWDPIDKEYLVHADDVWELDCEKTVSIPFLINVPEGLKKFSEVLPYDWAIEELNFEQDEFKLLSHDVEFTSI